MKYYTIAPPPPLAPYVKCFWVYEGEASSASPFIHRSYADGLAEMAFHYRGIFDQVFDDGTVARSFRSGLHAQSTHFTRFLIKENFGIFGVYLYPFAISKLFSLAASELTGRLPDLFELFGPAGRELEERVMLAPTNSVRVHLVSEFMIDRLARSEPDFPLIFSSVSHVIRTQGRVSVEALADRYFTSRRSFERNFKECAGLAPKLFSRLVRFQSTVKEYGKPGQSLTDIAHDFGYYDQSHFIHEFKEFSGYNPKAFFSGRAEGVDYLEL